MGVGCVCICNGSERLRRRALAGPCPSALLSLDYSCRSLCRLVWPRAGLRLISLLPYVLLVLLGSSVDHSSMRAHRIGGPNDSIVTPRVTPETEQTLPRKRLSPQPKYTLLLHPARHYRYTTQSIRTTQRARSRKTGCDADRIPARPVSVLDPAFFSPPPMSHITRVVVRVLQRRARSTPTAPRDTGPWERGSEPPRA